MYPPDVMLISFDDGNTGTSNIKFIRQSSALDMGKLYDGFRLYWRVRSLLLLFNFSFLYRHIDLLSLVPLAIRGQP
jgi:hypothetical protein